jgi:hypothetical protein
MKHKSSVVHKLLTVLQDIYEMKSQTINLFLCKKQSMTFVYTTQSSFDSLS